MMDVNEGPPPHLPRVPTVPDLVTLLRMGLNTLAFQGAPWPIEVEALEGRTDNGTTERNALDVHLGAGRFIVFVAPLPEQAEVTEVEIRQNNERNERKGDDE